MIRSSTVVGWKNPVFTRTNRLRFNLGRGEYEWPELRVMRPVGPGGALAPIALARLSVTYGRLLTLGAVDEIEPGVLDDLGGQPFEALNRSSWNAERDGLLSYEVILAGPRLRDLRASLEAWSDLWHLNDKWCLELAVSTLTHKSGGERLAWFEPRTHFGGIAPPFRAPFPPPLGLRPYDPVREWRADYLDHAPSKHCCRRQAIASMCQL
jgi:hypothetical protein